MSHTSRILSGILVVAVAMRLVAALLLSDQVVELPGIQDQITYDTLARRVLGGYGFSFASEWWPVTRAGEPTAHWSFLYVLYLAGTYTVFGEHPLAARLVQAAVAGALTPLLAWRIGRRVFGVRAGLVAAALAAVYGYFVYYAGALMTETFYILAILWALDLATGLVQAKDRRRPRRHLAALTASTETLTDGSSGRPRPLAPSPPSGEGVAQPGVRSPRGPAPSVWKHLGAAVPWLVLGLALGTAALLRQIFLLIVPLLFVWLVWALARGRALARDGGSTDHLLRIAGGLLCTMFVVAIMVAPWTVRNYQAFGRFVLLNTNAGYAFFWGNHPIYGSDFVPILPPGTYQRLIPDDLRGLDEAALDQALLREGVRFVVEDPVRYARLSLSRVRDYFMFWPAAESSPASNVVRTFSFGLYLPFMAYGLWVAWFRRPAPVLPGQGAAVILLVAFAAVYSAIHLLTWALIRYRLPVDAVLMPFAAVAILDLGERLAAWLRPRNALVTSA